MSSEPRVGGETAPGSPDGEAAIELRGVRRTYQVGEPVHALDGVDLTIPRGSYTAVMGPSGSGKSTLMNLVGCLDTPTEGTVWVDGREVTAMSGRERTRLRGEEIGFVFQTFNLMPRMTALENVALPLVFAGVGRAERDERARGLLERVGLGDRTGHRPNELSGGQRQRVAIARAVAADPALILADEPTGNLDTETGASIMDLFDDLNAEGNTVMMVTHERHIAERADRIVHLLDGRIERIEELDGGDGGAGDGGSTVDGPDGSTVDGADGSTVDGADGSTVDGADGSTVDWETVSEDGANDGDEGGSR